MNFLGVGPMELLIVAGLAYFLLGPKKMSEAGKSIGKILRDFRAQRDEFTSLLMESVDIEDKPKRPPVPSTPVGAVAQSGDRGDTGDSGDPDDEAGASNANEAADRQADGEQPAGSDSDSNQNKGD